MPSPYRPRPIEIKRCEQCGVPFESRHQRARFCCNSCRTQAFYARHGRQLPKAESEGAELSFSWQNVGVVATAVSAVDLTKHLLTPSDQQQENFTKLIQEVRGLRQQVNHLKSEQEQARIEAEQKELNRQVALIKTAGR